MSRTFRKTYPPYEGWIDNKYDGKKFYKPTKRFKKLQKKSRKAKEREALKLNKEVIPEFPKTDQWLWN